MGAANGADNSSPMLDQYRRIKKEHQGEVLFFRLGDFYEMFGSDALEISAALNLTLTSRNGQPMCGVPYHAARSYIARLLKLGKKIAICEQLTQPIKGKQVIEREVVEVITPGTTVEEDYLEKGASNYLACISRCGTEVSFAYIDLSAGDFHATAFPLDGAGEKFSEELQRLELKEILVQESLLEENAGLEKSLSFHSRLVLNRWADWLFDIDKAKTRLEKQFGLSNLKSFGLNENSPELLSAGALLEYLDDTAKSLIPHISTIAVYHDTEYAGIDEASQRNLELVRSLHDGDVRFSLLEVMDHTRCAMGRRLLSRRILHPLRNIQRIGQRLDMVETLYRDQAGLADLREILGKTPDLLRLCSRLAMDKAHGKDMLAVKNALDAASQLKQLWETSGFCFESEEGSGDKEAERRQLMELRDLLERGICPDPAIVLGEGNLIRDGYSVELDELRKLKDSGRQLLETYLEEEKSATGIGSLKIRYNRLIGYFFEVTKNHLEKVPSHFIRRQGMATGERFSTERLAELESDINGAADKIIELERKLFIEIREQAKLHLTALSAVAHRIAEIDCAQSLAKAASIHAWVRPELDESPRMEIYEGRHPVVEAHLGRAEFIPNDILLNAGTSGDEVAFALITGPNMAGKSTYLRSAALIVIMAQMGSFVPAREARLGICDRIYCRVGASDNLARGESTFLVEMNETAYILNTATEQSLVIMDEVGRGTGTNDGLSIAWAVSEELLNRVKCRTLFATHYHELSLISHPRMANRSMEVLDQKGEIHFLRRLREGPASESYGIHVAKLAGLPAAALKRAAKIMEKLRERDASLHQTLGGGSASATAEPPVTEAGTLESFSFAEKETLAELQSLDINAITPLDALQLLSAWKEALAGDDAVVLPKTVTKSKHDGLRAQQQLGEANTLPTQPQADKPRSKPDNSALPSLFD